MICYFSCLSSDLCCKTCFFKEKNIPSYFLYLKTEEEPAYETFFLIWGMDKAPPPQKKKEFVSHTPLLDTCKVEKYQSLCFNIWLALDLWFGIVRCSVYCSFTRRCWRGIFATPEKWTCRSQWPRGLRRRAARLLRCEFESHWTHRCFSVESVMCCQVEVSATSRSLFQRSPTNWCVVVRDLETCWMRRS